MLFDWLVVSQVLPVNPAAAIRGPKCVARRGKTPVLSAEEARHLLDSIDTTTLVEIRDRALIAVIAMRVGDCFQQGKKYAHECPFRSPRLSEAALSILTAHSWPGNVREIEGAIRRALTLAASEVLEPCDFETCQATSECAGGVTAIHFVSEGEGTAHSAV